MNTTKEGKISMKNRIISPENNARQLRLEMRPRSNYFLNIKTLWMKDKQNKDPFHTTRNQKK